MDNKEIFDALRVIFPEIPSSCTDVTIQLGLGQVPKVFVEFVPQYTGQIENITGPKQGDDNGDSE